MLLLISSARRLTERYGEDGFLQIRQALRDVADSQPSGARVIFPDDIPSMARWSLEPMPLSGGVAVRVALRRISKTLGKAPSGILIVGGDEVIPFYRLPNPVRNRFVDPDPEVLTDNPYGLGPEDTFDHRLESLRAPKIPVGRLPDASPVDPDAFLRQIQELARSAAPGRHGTFALVDESFHQVPARVLPRRPTTLRVSPGWHSGDSEWRSAQHRLYYFNLHGFDDRPAWRGFDPVRDRWVDAVRPRDITREAAAGAVVFAENCYGASVQNRSPRQSIALSFLDAGVRGFVGATGTAFGSYFSPLTAKWLFNADLLAQKFVEQLDGGASLGESLVAARREFWEKTPDNSRKLPFAQKTALQFVLFGNPLVKV